MKIELAKTEVVHFVGIGGIGMSGLSLIMKGMGFNIQGSDISNNKNIDRLIKNKIKITIKHEKKNIKKATILVISSAINEVIHFIGIGGIGMSGLSLIMKGMGFNVQGSDISNNKNIDRLKKKKLKFQLGIRGKIYKKQL